MSQQTTWIKRLTLGGGALALSVVGVVKHNEGYSPNAYYDGARIATICYGETKGVKIGMTRTKSECDAQLQKSLEEHAVVFEGIPQSTTDVVALGTIDMAYNVGVYGFNSSRVKRFIIAGDYKKAGEAVLAWKFISRDQTKNPGKGWERVSGNKWRFDCSQFIGGKPNTVCYGLWKRRAWQSKVIGNQFKTPQEALEALYAIYR